MKINNFRIKKSIKFLEKNEIKPEIKKVKKQQSEKREYKIKDYVVYPKHGVGQITEFKKISKYNIYENYSRWCGSSRSKLC